MPRTVRIYLLVTVVIGGLNDSAAASPITFAFTGSVTQISVDDPDPFGGAIVFGTPFSGSYTFESTASDTIPAPTDGSYPSPYALSVDFAGIAPGPFSVTGFVVNTRNGSPDQYGVFGSDGSVEIQFLLESNANPLSSDALLLTPSVLTGFPQPLFTFRYASGLPEILGDLTSLTCIDGCAVVPEPATFSLVLIGLAGSLLHRRRLARARRSS